VGQQRKENTQKKDLSLPREFVSVSNQIVGLNIYLFFENINLDNTEYRVDFY